MKRIESIIGKIYLKPFEYQWILGSRKACPRESGDLFNLQKNKPFLAQG
jgi:hypothetical protein